MKNALNALDKLKKKSLLWLWFWTIFPIILLIILAPNLNPEGSYINYSFGVLGIIIAYSNGKNLFRYYKYIKIKSK